MRLPTGVRRKFFFVAAAMIGSGLTLAMVSWLMKVGPSNGGVIGIWLAAYGLIALSASFSPPGEWQDKPRWIQVLMLLILLVDLYLDFVSARLPWQRDIGRVVPLLVILVVLWPNQKRDLRDRKPSSESSFLSY